MSSRPNILLLAGSIRANSTSLCIAQSINKYIASWATTSDVLTYENIPLFNEDLEAKDMPYSVLELEEKIKASDGLIICSPEYNASLPGGLKNALDWLSRPHGHGALRGKVVSAVVHTIFPKGGYGAYNDFIRILSHMGNIVHYHAKARVHGFRERDGKLLKNWDNDLALLLRDYHIFFNKMKSGFNCSVII